MWKLNVAVTYDGIGVVYETMVGMTSASSRRKEKYFESAWK